MVWAGPLQDIACVRPASSEGAAADAMGTNLLDAVTAAPSLEAGLTQAMSCSGPAHTIWSAT